MMSEACSQKSFYPTLREVHFSQPPISCQAFITAQRHKSNAVYTLSIIACPANSRVSHCLGRREVGSQRGWRIDAITPAITSMPTDPLPPTHGHDRAAATSSTAQSACHLPCLASRPVPSRLRTGLKREDEQHAIGLHSTQWSECLTTRQSNTTIHVVGEDVPANGAAQHFVAYHGRKQYTPPDAR